MGLFLANTAQIRCSMGVAPAVLIVIRPTILFCNQPAANIMDYKPIANVPPFGMCNSTSNPAVIAATAAALGVHTPAPCVPNIVAPWAPGIPKVLVQKQPAVDDGCKLNCLWAGVITVSSAGQTKVKT
jgi:hypothetical protein